MFYGYFYIQSWYLFSKAWVWMKLNSNMCCKIFIIFFQWYKKLPFWGKLNHLHVPIFDRHITDISERIIFSYCHCGRREQSNHQHIIIIKSEWIWAQIPSDEMWLVWPPLVAYIRDYSSREGQPPSESEDLTNIFNILWAITTE